MDKDRVDYLGHFSPANAGTLHTELHQPITHKIEQFYTCMYGGPACTEDWQQGIETHFSKLSIISSGPAVLQKCK